MNYNLLFLLYAQVYSALTPGCVWLGLIDHHRMGWTHKEELIYLCFISDCWSSQYQSRHNQDKIGQPCLYVISADLAIFDICPLLIITRVRKDPGQSRACLLVCEQCWLTTSWGQSGHSQNKEGHQGKKEKEKPLHNNEKLKCWLCPEGGVAKSDGALYKTQFFLFKKKKKRFDYKTLHTGNTESLNWLQNGKKLTERAPISFFFMNPNFLRLVPNELIQTPIIVSKKMSTKSFHKKCPQKVSTNSVHKKRPH